MPRLVDFYFSEQKILTTLILNSISSIWSFWILVHTNKLCHYHQSHFHFFYGNSKRYKYILGNLFLLLNKS